MVRTLTEPQKAAITNAIGALGHAEFLVDPSVEDAQAYADEFSTVFTDAGWTVVLNAPEIGRWPSSPSGLLLISQGDLPQPSVIVSLTNAFLSTDVAFNWLDGMLPEDVDVKLVVGRVGV